MMEIHNMMDFHHMVDIHHMMKFHHMMGFHHFVFSLWNQFQLWKNIMHWRSFSFRDELGEATVCGIHRLTDADDDQHGVDNQAASADGDPSVGWNMLQLLFKSESLYNYFRCCNCKRKQSLLHDTVLSNSNTTLRDFVLLMYQFCNSHRTYDTVTKENFLPQTGYKETHLSPNTINRWFSYFRLLCMRAQAGNYNLEEYLHLFMWMEGRSSWATTHSGLLLLWCSADNSLETLKEATKRQEITEAEVFFDEEDEDEADSDDEEDTDDDDLELFHFYDCIGCKAIFRDSWESWSFAACHILWKSLV